MFIAEIVIPFLEQTDQLIALFADRWVGQVKEFDFAVDLHKNIALLFYLR